MNWKELVHDLADQGFRQVEIAEYCGCSQSCIGNLASGLRGKRLNFSIGSKLADLHKSASSGEVKPKKQRSK